MLNLIKKSLLTTVEGSYYDFQTNASYVYGGDSS